MSKKGTYVGIAVAIVAVIVVFLYTNVFELVSPTVTETVDSAKNAISKVNGSDVVKGAEIVSKTIVNETSKIEIKDPFP
ncbi:MAG: hypothetical protein OEL77_09230 [Nitrosopumilus sp.]|nr:hypothetical protein [Nitrosopumilus sp.]MDH3386180.1 hypothetical protein [Nitrosopumilus sp.]